MVADTTAFGIGLAEWAIIIAAIIFTLDVLGISRSSRTIRRENADLKERNQTLEIEVRDLQGKVSVLEKQVEELKAHNVEALFAAFREHDERMSVAATALTSSLTKLADEIGNHEERADGRHKATLTVLNAMTEKLT